MIPGLKHPLRTILTTGAVVATAIALVACGSGSDSSSEDEQANFEDAQVEFAECMRENGVDLPDPEPGQEGFGFRLGDENGIDPGSDEFQAASEECQPLMEDAIPEGQRPDPAEIEDELLELTDCLRDKGFDVPDPQIAIAGSGEEPEVPDQSEIDRMEELSDDPEFQQAQEDCVEETGVELPGGPGGPGGPDSSGDGG